MSATSSVDLSSFADVIGYSYNESMSKMGAKSENISLKTSFMDASRAALQSALSEIEINWPGSLTGDNPDAIHDLRVGTRRLRAALSIYQATLPEREYRRAQKAVAELTDTLGPARDADVLIEHLDAVVKRYELDRHDDAVGVQNLTTYISKLRKNHQSDLRKTLRGFDLHQLKTDISSINKTFKV